MDDSTESRAYQRPDGIWVFPRQEFAKQRFVYNAGEHVLAAGPTQRGKTSLFFVLLPEVSSPDLPAIISVSKPVDKVSAQGGKALGYPTHDDWPPQTKLSDLFEDKPSGRLVWPRFGDVDNDVANATEVNKRLLNHVYTDGTKGHKVILVMDDTVFKSKILKLDDGMVVILTMGGAMGIGMWGAVQKPTDAGKTALWFYSAAEHLFIFSDKDKRNRARYSEIGGFNPKQVEEITLTLKPYQCLYLKRTGEHMCIVDSK